MVNLTHNVDETEVEVRTLRQTLELSETTPKNKDLL